jgi:RNA polymerase sigma-70 factor, ECF subfamily
MDRLPHQDDFELAQRCLAREPAALRVLERDYIDKTDSALEALGLCAADRDEVKQMVRVRLLVDEPPRLAQYTGEGRLLGFVRAVAVRLALDERRRLKSAPRSDADLLSIVDGSQDAELALAKRVSRAQFRRAFGVALGHLTPTQRTLLRYAYVDGLSNESIAHLHGTHRVTVFRWLVEARRTLGHRLRSELASTLRLPLSEVPPLAAFVRSELSLSLSRVLA